LRRSGTRWTSRVVTVGLLAGGLAAALAWPRINDVETGKTAEYPDLRARDYAASAGEVTEAVKRAVSRLPGWAFVGSGSGPGGSEVRAVRTMRWLGFKEDVTVRIRSEGRGARVSVRSRSRLGPWDFGQNARNIRGLLAALDGELTGRGVD
jgi:uncharacterized protein (DUF1499 family)